MLRILLLLAKDFLTTQSLKTMMEESKTEQASAPAGSTEGGGRDFVDMVCDPCGLVPNNLEVALAHKQKMKLLQEKVACPANTTAAMDDTPEDEKATDIAASYFNIDCCGKAPAAGDEVEVKEFPAEKMLTEEENIDVENPEEQIVKNEDETSMGAGTNSQQTRSLADIAAKMDEIDLETAAEETAESEDDSIQKMGSNQVWYKEPLYAGLIVFFASLIIAIIVLVILLIVNRN